MAPPPAAPLSTEEVGKRSDVGVYTGEITPHKYISISVSVCDFAEKSITASCVLRARRVHGEDFFGKKPLRIRKPVPPSAASIRKLVRKFGTAHVQ